MDEGALPEDVETAPRYTDGMARAAEPLPRPETKPGTGIDRTLIRRLLALTPGERIELLVAEARNLAAFDATLKRKS